jgi:tetratricopeptide (TPR) repeat protein
MKPLHLLTITLLLSCGVSRETIRYELPPKQAGDNPEKLQAILAFKTIDAEKLFDKDDLLLEGKIDELKKIAGKESSNPIVLKALAKVEGKLTNLDKAKTIYEKAGLTNNSHYAWVLHDYGDYYNGREDYLKAEENYDNAIKIYSSQIGFRIYRVNDVHF